MEFYVRRVCANINKHVFLSSGSTRKSPVIAYGQSSLVSPFALPYLKAALLFPVAFSAHGLRCGVCSRETECKTKQNKTEKRDNFENKHPLLGAHPQDTLCWFACSSGQILTPIPAPSTVKTSLRSSQLPALSLSALIEQCRERCWGQGCDSSGCPPCSLLHAGLTCECILCCYLYLSIASSIHGLFLYSPGNSPRCPQLFNSIIKRLVPLRSGDWLTPSLPRSSAFLGFQTSCTSLGFHQIMDSGQEEKSHFSHPFKLSFLAVCELLVTAKPV